MEHPQNTFELDIDELALMVEDEDDEPTLEELEYLEDDIPEIEENDDEWWLDLKDTPDLCPFGLGDEDGFCVKDIYECSELECPLVGE